MNKPTASEGTSFVQKGGKRGGAKESFDKKYWKDKECYNCGEQGHPANHCHNRGKKGDDKKDDDSKSVASTAKSVLKLKKDFKNMSKQFTTVNAQLEQLKAAVSDLSGSDVEEEASHFQISDAFLFTQCEQFEPKIAKLFKQAGTKIKLELRQVILLDSQ